MSISEGSMSVLQNLPVELFIYIIRFLDDPRSKEDIVNLCLLSKTWVHYIRPILYGCVDISAISSLYLFHRTLLQQPQYASFTKTLTLALTSSLFPENSLGDSDLSTQDTHTEDPFSRLLDLVSWTKTYVNHLSVKVDGYDLLNLRPDIFSMTTESCVLSFTYLKSFSLDTFSGMLDFRPLISTLPHMIHLQNLSLSFIRVSSSSSTIVQHKQGNSNINTIPTYTLCRVSFNYVFLSSKSDLHFIMGQTTSTSLRSFSCCCFTHTDEAVRVYGSSLEHLSLDNSLGFLNDFLTKSNSISSCHKLRVLVLTGSIARGVEMLDLVAHSVQKLILQDLISLNHLEPYVQKLQYNRIVKEKDRLELRMVEVDGVVEGLTDIENFQRRFAACGVSLTWN